MTINNEVEKMQIFHRYVEILTAVQVVLDPEMLHVLSH